MHDHSMSYRTWRCWVTLLFSVGALWCAAAPLRADEVETLKGLRLKGEITQESPQSITIRVTTGGRSRNVDVRVSEVYSVTKGGVQRILNQKKPATTAKPKPGGSASTKTPPKSAKASGKSAGKGADSATTGEGSTRTREEVDELITREGKSPPPWWDDVQLNYPPTLQLDWPEKPNGGWNSQVNVGQYLWDVINPNPGKWKEGVRLMHHILKLHGKDSGIRTRAVNSLGHLYADCLEDYARAAFWWRLGGGSSLDLANCYWKLGNREMAEEILQKYGSDNTRHAGVIRLWSDMGEFDKAMRLANQRIKSDTPDVGYLAAGDTCRVVGRFDEALRFYEKAAAVTAGSRDLPRNQNRARASIEAIKVFDSLDLSRIADGAYKQSSLGYEAPVEVEVMVKGNRIETVRVTQHREKQFYSALTDTPNQIIQKQGVRGIDATSGATITSEAIINATAKALAGGMK